MLKMLLIHSAIFLSVMNALVSCLADFTPPNQLALFCLTCSFLARFLSPLTSLTPLWQLASFLDYLPVFLLA